MLCAMPASAEPTTNNEIASCTSSFLLIRSDSLPQIGVDTVVASRLAVRTQVYCVWLPWRSAVIVGRALLTIVELSIAVNSAASSPTRISRISRWVSSGAAGGRPGLGDSHRSPVEVVGRLTDVAAAVTAPATLCRVSAAAAMSSSSQSARAERSCWV